MIILNGLTLRAEMSFDSYEKFRAEQPDMPFVAMLYAPWCGHCKNMHPLFIKCQEEYEDDPDIMLMGVDCNQHDDLCKTLNASGYPTFVHPHEGFYEHISMPRKLGDRKSVV